MSYFAPVYDRKLLLCNEFSHHEVLHFYKDNVLNYYTIITGTNSVSFFFFKLKLKEPKLKLL